MAWLGLAWLGLDRLLSLVHSSFFYPLSCLVSIFRIECRISINIYTIYSILLLYIQPLEVSRFCSISLSLSLYLSLFQCESLPTTATPTTFQSLDASFFSIYFFYFFGFCLLILNHSLIMMLSFSFFFWLTSSFFLSFSFSIYLYRTIFKQNYYLGRKRQKDKSVSL